MKSRVISVNLLCKCWGMNNPDIIFRNSKISRTFNHLEISRICLQKNKFLQCIHQISMP